MIVQTYFPQKLSPLRYDHFLASGWFRGSMMLYKMDLLCIEQQLFSVVNIRLDLNRHEMKKRHRKIMRKVENEFRVETGLASIDARKEHLYTLHKNRFKGFIHTSLDDYLNSGFTNSVFDTRELRVYDGKELIAVSYFDLGGQSAASLLALYDHNYKAYSLGLYTMLKEVEILQNKGFRWYYPGYVLDKESSFDYKLQLGEFEYYNHNQRWVPYRNFHPGKGLASKILDKLKAAAEGLKKLGVEHEVKLYPFYSFGHMGYWKVQFLGFPKVIVLRRGGDDVLILSYESERDMYVLVQTSIAKGHEHLINMEISLDFETSDIYLLELLKVDHYKEQSRNLESMLDHIQNTL